MRMALGEGRSLFRNGLADVELDLREPRALCRIVGPDDGRQRRRADQEHDAQGNSEQFRLQRAARPFAHSAQEERRCAVSLKQKKWFNVNERSSSTTTT